MARSQQARKDEEARGTVGHMNKLALRVRRAREWWHDHPARSHNQPYVLAGWKERTAFVVVGAGIGGWLSLVFGRLLLCVVVGVVVALLLIWGEARRHDPPDR